MQASSAEDVRKWVIALSGEAGLTVSQLANRAGLQPSTLTRFIKGNVDGAMLSGRTLQKLHMVEAGIQREKASSADVAKPSAAPAAYEQRAAFQGQDGSQLRLFLLELASSDATGPEGSGDLEMVRSVVPVSNGEPWPITGKSGNRRFAIYMPGEFMRPRFRTGECLIIDSLRPAAIGSDVLVEFMPEPGHETLGTIAELVGRDRSQVRLTQFQHDGVTTIHRSRIRNIFSIVGTFQGDVAELGLSVNFG